MFVLCSTHGRPAKAHHVPASYPPLIRPLRYSKPRPWRSLTDDQFQALAPYFIPPGAGRPIFDLRGRLNAILWVTCHHPYRPWRELPARIGPWALAARQFRRWVHAGIFTRLLQDAARPGANPALKRMEHWICRLFRRAQRILGLAGIELARRLGLATALRAPDWMIPNLELTESVLAWATDETNRAEIRRPKVLNWVSLWLRWGIGLGKPNRWNECP